MIRMKKLRSSGIPGANEGHIRRGREFTVTSEQRAQELEEAGLAVRLMGGTKAEPSPLNNAEPSASNKAAAAGPLASHGGETGAESTPSLSDQDHPPRRQRLKKPAVGLDL